MSTKDQILSAELHGEALLTAKRPELQPLIDDLKEPRRAATISSWSAPASLQVPGSLAPRGEVRI
jgi:hypothetical protein